MTERAARRGRQYLLSARFSWLDLVIVGAATGLADVLEQYAGWPWAVAYCVLVSAALVTGTVIGLARGVRGRLD